MIDAMQMAIVSHARTSGLQTVYRGQRRSETVAAGEMVFINILSLGSPAETVGTHVPNPKLNYLSDFTHFAVECFFK